jgi:RHS repeat-associated protein
MLGHPPGVTYDYDADGQRVEKSSGTMYWPGPSGTLAETDLSGNINEEYVYFNGERIARVDRPSGTIHYYFSDHLGSASVITNPSGNVYYYYYPFGGMAATIGSDPNHYKFTGKERDTESALDNFEARHYGSSLGRFMQPDPGGGHLEDPQTLNRYAYVRNNPLSLTDPTGLDFYLSCQHSDNNGSTCQQMQVGTDKNGNAQMAWVQGVTGDNGFTATQIGNDANGNLVDRTTGTGTYTADVTGSGVQLSNGGTSTTGVFLNKDVDLSGTNQVQSYDTVVRAGNMPGFLFTFQNSKMEANQNAAGFFTFDGTMHDAGEVLNSAGFHYMGPIGLNWNHAEYRSWEDSSGRSGHFNLEWSKTNPLFNVPTVGDMHFGEHNVVQSPYAHLKESQQ